MTVQYPAIIADRSEEMGTWAHIDEPRREIRFGVAVTALFFVGFLGWAALTPLDAAAYAPGRLVVSGQRQAVQHRDGGVVSALHVKEGQQVQKGDVLIELAATEIKAQEKILSTQVINLEAQRARLRAEQAGLPTIAPPAEFAALAGDDKVEAERALRVQQQQFSARRSSLVAQRGVLHQRGNEAFQQGKGMTRQEQAAGEQERIVNEQLEMLKPVAEKGWVSKTRLRELERVRAELRGQRGQYAAGVAQTRASAGESQLQVIQAEKAQQERVSSELRDVEFSLSDLLPKLRAAEDQLARSQIRAPATGSVVGLSVFTVGGVIVPGQKLMDIVPDRERLIIEARLAPDDANDVTVGQTAEVKFSAIHERSIPKIEGSVSRVSADSFTDQRTGATYYTAEVSVKPEALKELQKVRGASSDLRAGLPVQVLIPLKKRTALRYLFEPLLDTMWKSGREH